MNEKEKKLNDLIIEGKNYRRQYADLKLFSTESNPSITAWLSRVFDFICDVRGTSVANRLLSGFRPNYAGKTGHYLRILEDLQKNGTLNKISQPHIKHNSIFLVHGHDLKLKDEVDYFIRKQGLDVVVLQDEPNNGLTIIEKLELYGDVSYAVVLMTPDDVVFEGSNEAKVHRSRQNVVLELGYFIGKLGRSNVCVLNKEVELPSDYGGVVYISVKDSRDWKLKLAAELEHAGFKINLTNLT